MSPVRPLFIKFFTSCLLFSFSLLHIYRNGCSDTRSYFHNWQEKLAQVKMKRKCRVWWPSNLIPSTQPQLSALLFGWFVPSSSVSLDIVVAFAFNEASLSAVGSDLKGILRMTNEKMPVSLQDKCMLSMLGHLTADPSSNGQLARIGTERKNQINYPDGNLWPATNHNMLKDSHGRWICGCYKFDGFLEQCRQTSTECNWIQLVYGSTAYSGRKFGWIPKLHHVHWDGQVVSHFDLHVVIYEIPRFGSHHFAVGFLGYSKKIKTPVRKPKWVEDLHQSQPLLELDPVMLAINCVTSAKSFVEELVCPDGSTIRLRIMCMCDTLIWKLLAVSVACVSTIIYIILQLLHFIGSYGSNSCIHITLAKLFSHTRKNIRVRCCQILYWPIFPHNSAVRSSLLKKNALESSGLILLLYAGGSFSISCCKRCLCRRNKVCNSENTMFIISSKFVCTFEITDCYVKRLAISCSAHVFLFLNSILQPFSVLNILVWLIVRSGSCTEYAEKASLRNHSMWSAVAVDVLLGNLLGIALLIYAESACLWVSAMANDITTYWLRISCARLMGSPAGFKLNTELARVLGMISLNSIQIWSTLWVLVGSLFICIIKGLAISGVLFGLTTFAAIVRDMISVSTLHVSALHGFISLLYSQQIRAIAAFWRLFRGQKWNPLRQRLDSYDYTVEQHIVGSLVFTPLLLLLPTTSAFYIFFTIMNSTVNAICMLIEVAISVIHATPYNKVFLWLVRPSRFPGGIWFEILSFESHTTFSSEIECLDNASLETPREGFDRTSTRSDVLTSYLHSYSLNIGEVVWPHFRYLCSAISRSSVASSAYGIFSGRSLPFLLYKIPSAPGAGLPSRMPWMFIPYKDYWFLCHDAVFACKPEYKRC